MTKKQLREQRRAEKETEAEGRDVRAAADVRPVMNEPDHLADAIARVLGPNDRDDDIPIETRRELMQCAVSNGRISYYYLCDIWRRGRLAGKGCHMDLERLVIDLQAHAKEHGWQDTDEPISALLVWRPGVGGGSSSRPPQVGDLVSYEPESIARIVVDIDAWCLDERTDTPEPSPSGGESQ